jgi:hypothetical protein
MVELIRVTGCKDPMRWYAKLIGQTFPRLVDQSQHKSEEWKVRASDGYSNFILHSDGEIVESLPLVGDLQIDPPPLLATIPDLREVRLAAKSFKALVSRTLDEKFDGMLDHYPDILESLVALEIDLDEILMEFDNPE